MSRDDDRITIPTNGHRPAPVGTPAGVDEIGEPDLRFAVTPARLAVGLGVVASLVLLLLRRFRRGG